MTFLERRLVLLFAVVIAVAAQREALEHIRADRRINADEYNRLLAEIDWRGLTARPEDGRRIEES